MDLEKICRSVCEIARQTGDFIQKESSGFNIKDAKLKGKHDFVSYVDIEAEKQLAEYLGKLMPQAGFIAEEGTVKDDDNALKWIIDPLDGTTNFLHGLPVYSISIALSKNEDILLGVVFNIPTDELFYAYKDGGAYLNGQGIHTSSADKLEDSLIATGFPFKDYSRIKNFMSTLEFFIRNTHGVRRMGSAAVDLAYVACGRFDGFFEYGLNRWDVAAGILLISEAGGKASDFGGDIIIDGPEIVASNSRIFDSFRAEVEKRMN